MKIVAISDTHSRHHKLALPAGDMIIHAGDVSMRGLKIEIEAFLTWFASLDYKYKIFIAGNHDFIFENQDNATISAMMPHDIIYLNDAAVEIEGLKIWGSPITPWFHNWAFNRHRGPDIKKHWDLIPQDTDILITHGPVHGTHDRTSSGYLVGCEDLYEVVQKIKPKLHICGHIHEAYGMIEKQETIFVNASLLNLHYKLANEAVELTIP